MRQPNSGGSAGFSQPIWVDFFDDRSGPATAFRLLQKLLGRFNFQERNGCVARTPNRLTRAQKAARRQDDQGLPRSAAKPRGVLSSSFNLPAGAQGIVPRPPFQPFSANEYVRVADTAFFKSDRSLPDIGKERSHAPETELFINGDGGVVG